VNILWFFQTFLVVGRPCAAWYLQKVRISVFFPPQANYALAASRHRKLKCNKYLWYNLHISDDWWHFTPICLMYPKNDSSLWHDADFLGFMHVLWMSSPMCIQQWCLGRTLYNLNPKSSHRLAMCCHAIKWFSTCLATSWVDDVWIHVWNWNGPSFDFYQLGTWVGVYQVLPSNYFKSIFDHVTL